jgi:hypothetical protein
VLARRMTVLTRRFGAVEPDPARLAERLLGADDP